jgi:hypothetical protein
MESEYESDSSEINQGIHLNTISNRYGVGDRAVFISDQDISSALVGCDDAIRMDNVMTTSTTTTYDQPTEHSSSEPSDDYELQEFVDSDDPELDNVDLTGMPELVQSSYHDGPEMKKRRLYNSQTTIIDLSQEHDQFERDLQEAVQLSLKEFAQLGAYDDPDRYSCAEKS